MIYAIYETSHLSLKVIFFLTSLEYLSLNGYDNASYDYIEISEQEHQDFSNLITEGEELVFKDNTIQQMIYTEEFVKFLDNSYKKIQNYDFRKEGKEYFKTSETDADYLIWLQENAEKQKQEKINQNKALIFTKLQETDFIMLEDVAVLNKNDFKVYRAALRVLLASSDEDLEGDISLPVKPEEIWN
jgi:hypothetical protein